jgi:hypothetical protein
MACPVPNCKGDHFKGGAPTAILNTPAWALVRDYAALLLELGASMRDDASSNRKGAFISRLRDSEECYFKGLWVGLIATPEEVVHDASGANPRKTLAKLEEIVAKTVFNEDTTLSKNLADPGEPGFKAMDILNTSTHLTAMFLIYRSELLDADAANMYARGLRRIQTQTAHLNYSSDELKAGRDRKDIIDGLRKLRKKK